jgi:uncharacterized membrane protein
MKYTCEIEIDLPREAVLAKFDDPGNLKDWMRGLTSFELLEGEQGHPGARSKFVFQMGKRRFEIIETVTRRNPPDEYDGIYETPGMWNEQKNRFVALGPAKTKWIAESEFRMSGFMKVIGLLMPGSFRKQSQQHLEDFKAFAEQGKSVAA